MNSNLESSPAVENPTLVLVHGAFADSSSWNGVIRQLKPKGYPVIAVANPLRGLRSDAEYLRSVLDHVAGPIVLAGHSYGGSVMSEAADGAPGVTALVYVASFNLEPGESTAELAAKFPGGQLGPALDSVPFPIAGGESGMDLYIKQDRFRDVFAADVPPETAELMAATQRPIAASALEDRATKAAWHTILDHGHQTGPRHPRRLHALHGRACDLLNGRDRRVPRRDRLPARRRRRPDRPGRPGDHRLNATRGRTVLGPPLHPRGDGAGLGHSGGASGLDAERVAVVRTANSP
jgi:pimeloyl-ACP methyl ester carboxylesterase